MTGLSRLKPAARPGRTEPGFRIKDIRRTTVALPYRPVPAVNMARELPHRHSEICEVGWPMEQSGLARPCSIILGGHQR